MPNAAHTFARRAPGGEKPAHWDPRWIPPHWDIIKKEKKVCKKSVGVFFNYFYQQVKHANADGDRNGQGQE